MTTATLKIGDVEVEITFDISEVDGIPVLFIDTPEIEEDFMGPRLRVYLNEAGLWANPEFPAGPEFPGSS